MSEVEGSEIEAACDPWGALRRFETLFGQIAIS
jgi:hypothetical protein